MAAPVSPAPLPLTQNNSSFYHRQPSRQLPRNTTFQSFRSRGSPDPVYTNTGNGLFSMARSQPLTDGDSSDDEVPAPIKFSASVKALLGEDDGSGVDTSPAYNNGEPKSSNRQVNGSLVDKKGPSHERQVRVVSPVSHQKSPSPRIVRVGTASRSPPNPPSKESSFIQKEDRSSSKDVNEHRADFITPAPRMRTVRVGSSRSTTRSPSSDSPTGSRLNGKSSFDESRVGDRSFSGDRHRRHDENPRSGSSSVIRSRAGEEPGVQSSLRVKRVGKLTGSFLNGPARRGVIRRQSEENPDFLPSETPNAMDDPQTEDDEKPESSGMRHSGFHDKSRRSSNSPRSVGDNNVQAQNTPPHHSVLGPSEYLRSRTRSPSSLALRLKSPSSAGFKGPSLASNDGQPVYHVPPPPPLASKKDQENEPPPTFKRSKSHGFGLLDRADKFAVVYGDEKEGDNPNPASNSPRKPLNPKNDNTPRRPAPQPPPKMSVLEAATASAGAASSSQSRRKRAQITVNKKSFSRLDCIGRGGSARVYRVMAENGKIFALKRVNLEDVDSAALAGYKGEIDLLRKLEKVDRVVQLFDFEINEEKRALNVLMEMGELDLHRIITLRLNTEDAVFDPTFTRFYWREMLECVQAVHDFDIVHSDLKPANFLLVKGKLKLIDFGIANAIEDHTVNVHREQQIGTPNYMSPEALIDCNAASGLPSSVGKMMKIGKPSDVWSLGCILYQMVYGKPPFAHITKPLERIMAIPNANVVIEFPHFGVGGVPVPSGLVRTLKRCLQRDQTLRPSISQLLSSKDPFLCPDASLEGTVPITQEMLNRILTNVVHHCRTKGPPRDEEMASWPAGFFAKIKAAMEENAI